MFARGTDGSPISRHKAEKENGILKTTIGPILVTASNLLAAVGFVYREALEKKRFAAESLAGYQYFDALLIAAFLIAGVGVLLSISIGSRRGLTMALFVVLLLQLAIVPGFYPARSG